MNTEQDTIHALHVPAGFHPEDFQDIKRLGDAQISPDGAVLIYVLQRLHQDGDRFCTDLFRYEFSTGQTRPLTSSGTNSHPRISPDGSMMAFLSTREGEKSQIFLLDLVAGGEAKQMVTDEAVQSFQWLPDSRRILYGAQVFPFAADTSWLPYPGAPEADGERLRQNNIRKANVVKDKDKEKSPGPRVVTRFSYRRDGVGYFEQNRQQVFLLNLPEPGTEEKPQTRQITCGDWDHPLGTVSPDGRWLCISSQHVADPELRQCGQLWIYNLQVESTEPQLLLDAPGPVGEPLWSPDGMTLAFAGHDNRHGVSTSRHLYLLPLGTVYTQLQQNQPLLPCSWSETLNLTLPFDRPYGGSGASESLNGARSEKMWVGEDLYFLMLRHGAGYLYRYHNGQSEPVVGDEGRTLAFFAAHRERVVFCATAPDAFEELILLEKGSERRITAWNEKFYQQRRWGRVEKRFFTSSVEQQDVESWLVYPADFEPGKKYPLLQMVHGGPHGSYGPAFQFMAQLFSARGFFVVMVNPRGSVGYGQQFACCIDGDWGHRDEADLLSGVDDALSTGHIDPEQVFLYGWSYGGYAACWLATQTARYRAICAGAPVSDLYSDYGTADITMANEWEYGGQPWRNAAELHSRSALAHVEKVTTPLLLLHGEADLRCPVVQSEQFYLALKRLGKTVVMVRYPGEMHGLRQPKHLLDRYQRLLAWYEYHRKEDDAQ